MYSDPAKGPKDDAAQEVPGIVSEELGILARVSERVREDAKQEAKSFENLDVAMIELRDLIAEAKEEDVSSLVGQMHQVAALNQSQGKGKSVPVDPNNPYFGHLQLQSVGSRRARTVLIGKRTMLDRGDGLSIVDWRNAPVSRLFYRYDEGDDYEEEFDERVLEGTISLRRSLTIHQGQLRRIDCPQGVFLRRQDESWISREGGAKQLLSGGTGTAARIPRGQLGLRDEAGIGRSDKHLQEITALIDKEQFALITRSDSGVVLIQGGAGSGKTTVALHRVAYLNFQDPRRFAPSRMLIMVFNEALVEYIKKVLPALGVQGVTVTTYRRWTASLMRRCGLDIPAKRSESTPDPVSRFKKHPLFMEMIESLVHEQCRELDAELERKLSDRPGYADFSQQWRSMSNLAILLRCDRMIAWMRQGKGAQLHARTRAAAETVLRSARQEHSDLLSDWLELMGDSARLEAALGSERAQGFSNHDKATIVRWCTARASRLADDLQRASEDEGKLDSFEEKLAGHQVRELGQTQSERGEHEPVKLDEEDDAALLRLMQLKQGGIFAKNKRVDYEHIVIDEAQDLCPMELRVLLDCATAGQSITIAGDRAQKMIFDNGFQDWPQLLADAGLPHIAVQPLKITYRSTRPVMQVAQHVLGELHRGDDPLVAREGAPVGFFRFGEIGESVVFLADALRSLMRAEPNASVALITRYPQQAQLYYEALQVAEVPRLRLVVRQDFAFQPGIDVTDVRHVKGLEFDYVIVLDPTAQNYPNRTEARHLLHIASTRTAHQLWFVCSGQASELLPGDLVASGDMLSE